MIYQVLEEMGELIFHGIKMGLMLVLDHEGRMDATGRPAMLEIPASVGFLQSNFSLCAKTARLLARPSMRKTRLSGLLWRLRLLNKVWLTPELSSTRVMMALAANLRRNGYSVLNFTLHSTTLLPGLNHITPDRASADRFMRTIEEFLAFTRNQGYVGATLRELEAEQADA